MTSRQKLWLVVVAVALLALATWANVPFIGSILPGVVSLLGAITDAIGWAVALVAGAVGTAVNWFLGLASAGLAAFGLVAAAGLAGLPPVVVTAVGLTIATTSVAVSVRVLQPVVEQLAENPFTTIAPVIAIFSGYVTDLIAKAGGFESPISDSIGAANGFLVFGAESLFRKPRLATAFLAVMLLVLIPALLVGRILAGRPLNQIGETIAALPSDTILAVVVVTGAGVTAAMLGLVTKKAGAGGHDDAS